MNKSELIEAVAGRLGEGRSVATKAVDAVFDEIQRTVSKGERVAVTGFGVFEKRDRAARIARNPATGASVKVKKTSVPAFRPGQGFKDVVSGAKKLAKIAAPAAAARVVAARPAASRAAAKPAATRAAAAKPAAARKTAAKAAPARAAAKPAARKTAAKATPAARKTAVKSAPAAKKTAAKKATKKR